MGEGEAGPAGVYGWGHTLHPRSAATLGPGCAEGACYSAWPSLVDKPCGPSPQSLRSTVTTVVFPRAQGGAQLWDLHLTSLCAVLARCPGTFTCRHLTGGLAETCTRGHTLWVRVRARQPPDAPPPALRVNACALMWVCTCEHM